MASKDQIDALRSVGFDYADAARELGIPPGQAYLIATGTPADGAATLTRRARRTAGSLGSRAQALVNPREVTPTSRDDVLSWMRRRAFEDVSMRQPSQESR